MENQVNTPATPANNQPADNMATPGQPNNMPPRNKNRTALICAIIVIAFLLLGSAAYIGVTLSSNADSEELAYMTLENNDNPQDYKDFLEKYPDSKWSPEVRSRLNKLEQMISLWESISRSEKATDFMAFKETFDNPRFNLLCDMKIDSLDFIKAQRDGSPAAFQAYLSAHADGRYASEASVALGNLQSQEITASEREAVQQVINDFFEGFSSQDDDLICSNITASMKKFLHKSNVTKSAVVSAIKGMFNEHINSCRFVVNRDINIERKAETNDYSVDFTLDQHIDRDNSGKTFGSYRCHVEVTPQLLINVLTMEEISKQTSDAQ